MQAGEQRQNTPPPKADQRQPSKVCGLCGGSGRYMRQDAPRAGERFRYVMTDCPCGQGGR